jgi:nitrogen fixation/metabolism regulation signal transduction histidine kinase
MNVRTRLVLAYLAATLLPLAATVYVAHSLLDFSLETASTKEMETLAKTLEQTGRQVYMRERDALQADVASKQVKPELFETKGTSLPPDVREFAESGEQERYALGGDGGSILYYYQRRGEQSLRYKRDLGGVKLGAARDEHGRVRTLMEKQAARDLRQGFLYSFLLLAGLPWLIALFVLLWSAHRTTKPINQLTEGLRKMASNDLNTRLAENQSGEVGDAMRAFNQMAVEIEQSRERLVYLARLESWQALARKTAHEVKNSLTPIRLIMEELAARNDEQDAFQRQAAQIVVDEVNRLERRVRAFSEFAAEPPVHLRDLDAGAIVEERVRLLQNAHPEVSYEVEPAPKATNAVADEDLLKAVLTNLLENAAEAAGDHGQVLARTTASNGHVAIEVHDSGPGLNEQSRQTLFEPTISFKPGGMGLGLSIARKSALLCGGDIVLVKGELGGAGFRVLLTSSCQPNAS